MHAISIGSWNAAVVATDNERCLLQFIRDRGWDLMFVQEFDMKVESEALR